jgi:poly-gamma-glutamate synthesis protein (capsule biosynthesis protein)
MFDIIAFQRYFRVLASRVHFRYTSTMNPQTKKFLQFGGIFSAVIAVFLATTQLFSMAAPAKSGDVAAAGPSIKIVIAGDIMLDRNVFKATERAKNFEHPFLKIAPELAKYDVRVANLEGPITTTAFNMKRAQSMSFTFDPRFAPELAKHFNVVSLANNHTHNFQEKGLVSTKKYLSDVGVQYFGDPINRAGYTGRIIEKYGFKIGLVGYHAFGTPEKIGIATIEKEIKKMKSVADYIIVVPHWGAEYKPRAHASQIAAGHRFIDAGADAVVGGHPHVVQNVEDYKGHKIFYSLGNFIFDQYFSKETMEGFMVGITLVRNDAGAVSAEFKQIPYVINKESQPFIP